MKYNILNKMHDIIKLSLFGFLLLSNGINAQDTVGIIFDKILFYESANEPLQKKDRIYSNSFKPETRFINIELTVKNLEYKKSSHKYKLIFVWLKPNGENFGKINASFNVKKNWEKAYINRGWGYEKKGNWAVGVYTAQIFVDGKLFAEKKFVIDSAKKNVKATKINTPYSIKKRYSFIGLSFYDAYVIGSYDGISFFNSGDEIIGVPKLTNGKGAQFKWGLTGDKSSMEFAYLLTVHDFTAEIPYEPDSIYIATGKAYLNVVKCLDFKLYSHISKNLFWYGGLDLSISWTNIKNISYSFSDQDKLGKATYSGLILGLEGGFLWNPINKTSVFLGVSPAWQVESSLKGILRKKYNIKKFNNFRLGLDFGVTYNFRE